LAAPVSAQQGAAEQHNAVECDSALRAEPASQHEAGIAVLSALRDGVELKEPVHISKAVLAQREARVSLSGGTGPVACVMLVNIQLTPWADGPEKAEAFASGYNTAMKWYRSALLELADKVSAEFATRCRAEGGNTSNNEVSDLAAKAPAAQAVVMPDDWEEVVQSLEESYAGDSSLEWQGRAAQIIRLLAASPASTPEAAHADDTALNYNAGLVRKGIRDAVAAHALQPAAPGEPVAIIGSGYAILWLGGEPIAHIVERHGIKVGDVLYTAAPTASAATTELEKEVSIMYQMLDDGEWAEHVAKTCLGQQLETAITRAIGRVKSGAATTSEDGLEQLLIEHRIGLTPENEGGFHAYVYGDQELFKAKGYGQTPREAIDAAMRATQQEGGK
jgi:hypothetical protein